MSGIQMALLGSAGGTVVTTGSGTLIIFTSYTYYYGYDGALGGFTPNFGAISNDIFNGANLKAVYSISSAGSIGVNAGKAISYNIIFSGNRSIGFFNTLNVNNTLVSGTLSGPSYNSSNDETTFTITLATSTTTLFGSTDGVTIPVALT
jgi:hypothetical protein